LYYMGTKCCGAVAFSKITDKIIMQASRCKPPVSKIRRRKSEPVEIVCRLMKPYETSTYGL
ncbi:hypothetical protein T07_10895, partial [Trichinella nelsoni]